MKQFVYVISQVLTNTLRSLPWTTESFFIMTKLFFKHDKIFCDKTQDRTDQRVFIFVTSITDQTTKLEGNIVRPKDLMTTVATQSRK